MLGLSDCRSVDNNYIAEKAGLDDEGIKALEMIKVQDINEKREHKLMEVENGLSLVDIMNFIFKYEIENIVMAIRNFFKVKYKIPVFFDKENKKWICPKSDYEFSRGSYGPTGLWWLNLASNENTPCDNSPIALTDTFFESVALKDIEKRLYEFLHIYPLVQ